MSGEFQRIFQHHYKTSRLVICLRTKRRDAALKASRSMALKLEDYWMTLRLTQLDIPGLHLIRSSPASSNPSSKTLSDALEVYVELKGRNKGTVFKRCAKKCAIGHNPPRRKAFRRLFLLRCCRLQGLSFEERLIAQLCKTKLLFYSLHCKSLYSGAWPWLSKCLCQGLYSELGDIKAETHSIHVVRELQSICRQTDDEHRWLIALISDTGMRLSEATGLHINDLILEGSIPFINLVPPSLAVIKDQGKSAKIPLVGASLWAAQRIKSQAYQTMLLQDMPLPPPPIQTQPLQL